MCAGLGYVGSRGCEVLRVQGLVECPLWVIRFVLSRPKSCVIRLRSPFLNFVSSFCSCSVLSSYSLSHLVFPPNLFCQPNLFFLFFFSLHLTTADRHGKILFSALKKYTLFVIAKCMYNCNDSERESHAKSHCGHLARDAAEVAGHRIHKLKSKRKDAQSARAEARAENHYIGVSVDRNCSNGHLFILVTIFLNNNY